jgi:hypothetical protein
MTVATNLLKGAKCDLLPNFAPIRPVYVRF